MQPLTTEQKREAIARAKKSILKQLQPARINLANTAERITSDILGGKVTVELFGEHCFSVEKYVPAKQKDLTFQVLRDQNGAALQDYTFHQVLEITEDIIRQAEEAVKL